MAPMRWIRQALPEWKELNVEAVDVTCERAIIQVSALSLPRCPVCLGSEVSYHSGYTRTLKDLPWQGRRVEVHFRVRRFRCRDAECSRKIFAERISGLARPRARETLRLDDIVGQVGYALGGLPGSRLLASLGITASRETVLRRLKRPAIAHSKPIMRVIGVDDWAWRKRQRYGTILMDLEQNAVVDLLPDRSTESFTGWLERHPGVEIITRDRCGLYAAAGNRAAPDAVQIADRFHLLQNLSDALEHDIQRLQIEARRSGFVPTAPESESLKRLTLIEARRQRCRQARYERYQTVLDLTAKGYTQLAIAAQIGIDPETISRWTKAPGFPERRSPKDLPGSANVEWQHYSSSRMAALLSRPTKNLSREQASTLGAFLHFCPRAGVLRSFSARFRSMLRWRSSRRLIAWIDKAASSGFLSLAQFAKTMRRDLRAVQLAITTQWSNGPVEGHVNRLKIIKRQMYGRASFQLLKARVLPWSPSHA